jgi:hypothetical protein
MTPTAADDAAFAAPRPERTAVPPATEGAAAAPATAAGPSGDAQRAPAAQPVAPTGSWSRSRKRRPRQAKVVLRKLGPWSVFKVSLFFYTCVMAVIVLAAVILYAILGAMGSVNALTRLAQDLFGDKSFRIHGGWIFIRLVGVGVLMVVVWSLINVFVVFLYNLISDVIGGIEVTLSERR